VDVAHNPETVDVLNVSGHRPQQREFPKIERQHQFSLISPVNELTLAQAYVAVGQQPTGVSADESFRITGNGTWLFLCFRHLTVSAKVLFCDCLS